MPSILIERYKDKIYIHLPVGKRQISRRRYFPGCLYPYIDTLAAAVILMKENSLPLGHVSPTIFAWIISVAKRSPNIKTSDDRDIGSD